jgi:spermidine synthase
MLPWEVIAKAPAKGGGELQLAKRGDEWVVRLSGRTLMSSRAHGSEDRLALYAFERVERPVEKGTAAEQATHVFSVLIGGLGLGFTLRAALNQLPANGKAVVAELNHELVEWNRTHLQDLAGNPLADPRVRVQEVDVFRCLEAKAAYDVILLDVDNGPSAFSQAANEQLYDEMGIYACRSALKSGGVLGVWSAGPDKKYLEKLQRAGFDAVAKTVTSRPDGGVRHTLFLAKKTPPNARGRG